MKITWFLTQISAIKIVSESFLYFSFNDITFENVTEERTYEIVIDNELNCKSHLKNVCKKADRKFSAISRISTLATLN